ncbi:MAG: alanyl-tRNA editing protein [Erysipelotrichaceae bacterium]
MNEFDTLYYKDAYLSEFEATVVNCISQKNYYQIVLDNTAFYPEGGGQPSDLGKLNDIDVFDVKKKDGVIYHYTKQPLKIGQTVKGIIDFERRFDLMQQHTGEHLFSGVVHKLYGYDNIGFHLADDFITLDFSGPLSWNDVMKIEEKVNELIYQNIDVVELYPDAKQLELMDYRSKKELSGQVRIVEIADGDICACCGTHVHKTGEIGIIKALSCTNKAQGSRVVNICGKRAYNYLKQVYNQVKNISVNLSSNPMNIENSVNHLQQQYFEQKSKIHLLQSNYLAAKLADLPKSDEVLTVFESGIEANEFRKYIDDLAKAQKGEVICGFNEKQDGYNYVIVSYKIPLQNISKKLNAAVSGKGGGCDSMLQGSCQADKDTIINTIKQLF